VQDETTETIVSTLAGRIDADGIDRADDHYSKAVELNPNHANIAAKFASFLSYTGRPQAAAASVTRAIRLNPHHPDWHWQDLGLALYVGGRYTEAVKAMLI
jgi:adenylate cyclase